MRSNDRSEAQLRDQLKRIDWNFVDYNPSERAPEIHGLHWYPAPFPPGLVGTLIDVLGIGGTYLDPFSGSAVGPIEAWLRGYAAFGIDVNPWASRIARAKMSLLRSATAEQGRVLIGDYSQVRTRWLAEARGLTVQELCAQWAIQSDAARWFTPAVLRELAIVKQWIACGDAVRGWSSTAEVLVSSILHKRLSELREVHYTYIVDRSRTKTSPSSEVDAYTEIVNKIANTFVRFEVTRRRLERAGMMPESAQEGPAFITASSEDPLAEVVPDVDLVVTSPPYFGMNDYVRSQYLTELIFPDPTFWRQLQLEIGTRRNRRSATKLDEYLAVLSQCFKQVSIRMRVGGCVAVIAGASQSSHASVRPEISALENAICAAELKLLWTGTRRVIYRKINNTPFREEHIWVLRKV
jgi:DNA modification methylase